MAFDQAKASFAKGLVANGYSLREATAFNRQFREASAYRKMMFFGPDNAKAVLGDFRLGEAKEWLLVMSEKENVPQELIARFEQAKDKKELLELVDQLPEPDMPQLELFAARKGQNTFAGMWRLGNLTPGDVMQDASFALVLCEFNRER